MQNITTNQTIDARKLVINRVSYIPAGVSLALANLVSGIVVPEATPLTAPSGGVRTVCKQAQVLASSTTTVKKVNTGEHHFKVGDFLTSGAGTPSYAITTITSAAGVDDITVGTAIGATAEGTFIYEAVDEQPTTSVLENTPGDCILQDAFVVPAAGTMVLQLGVGLVRADVLEDAIAPEYLALLPHVAVIKY